VSDIPERPLDLRELFRALAAHGVDYLVIGGVAAQMHGRRRTTKDLDVTPAPDPENCERLAAALLALDAHPVELGPDAPAPTAEQLHLASIVPPLTTRHGELHILNEVPGATAYTGMRTRALTTDLDGIAISIVSVDDLIRMKQATGRPSDIEDIAALTMVAQREGRSAEPTSDSVREEDSALESLADDRDRGKRD
jgi:predicted nucleotidyltransferase